MLPCSGSGFKTKNNLAQAHWMVAAIALVCNWAGQRSQPNVANQCSVTLSCSEVSKLDADL